MSHGEQNHLSENTGLREVTRLNWRESTIVLGWAGLSVSKSHLEEWGREFYFVTHDIFVLWTICSFPVFWNVLYYSPFSITSCLTCLWALNDWSSFWSLLRDAVVYKMYQGHSDSQNVEDRRFHELISFDSTSDTLEARQCIKAKYANSTWMMLYILHIFLVLK